MTPIRHQINLIVPSSSTSFVRLPSAQQRKICLGHTAEKIRRSLYFIWIYNVVPLCLPSHTSCHRKNISAFVRRLFLDLNPSYRQGAYCMHLRHVARYAGRGHRGNAENDDPDSQLLQYIGPNSTIVRQVNLPFSLVQRYRTGPFRTDLRVGGLCKCQRFRRAKRSSSSYHQSSLYSWPPDKTIAAYNLRYLSRHSCH
ncbi:hypothetical protein M413DRAFT_259376 [Hebeloma cylindrosporum]|uniref:Uncharacterized protein n=1 Tax=Hebeloma cylindrosporum TaxID=76867 RepID=A0A0C3CRT1_HEBCY|nr:hypothetical protein M413DRAFT_259376 [Hebeloma cylindrosporum h7]